jgi:S1-C subfamily serine protease
MRELFVLTMSVVAGLVVADKCFSEDLASRFEKLSCAVVQVRSANETGTAFFVDKDGTLATVAHVLYDKKFHIAGNDVVVDLTAKQSLNITTHDGKTIQLNVSAPSQEDRRKALFDLALLKTGTQSPCFIPLGDSNTVKVGEHLISIGFPASAPTGVLYEGFLASRHARLALPFGPIEDHPDLQYTPHYEVLRVQMPLTPGSSGSPIISDQNTAIGIESEAPIIMAKDVQQIAAVFSRGQSSGIMLSGFDVTKIVGELAWTVQEFESPGAGLAVPVSNMTPSDFVRPLLPPSRSLPAHRK